MDSGNTAWVLASAALVLFMTPGLAFFYGGMVRSKNVLGMLMQNFFCMGLVSVLWALVVFSLAFGEDIGGGLLGGFDFVGLKDLGIVDPAEAAENIPGLALTIPPLLFVAFQLMFAIITPALITGAVADRMKFAAWVAFVALWLLFVYGPVAHWVFSPGGWLFERGALDFAGGTVVHINAGIAALALVMVLGKRKGWPGDAMAPHSLPFTLLGTGILWFGWFGFNAGSALAADGIAAQAFVNTHMAKGGHATTLGAASGAVAGLVAITPCAGFVGTVPALLIGFVAGIVCFAAIQLKFRFGYDDALDVVGIHLVGGILGSIAVGLFADDGVNPAAPDGLFTGGDAGLLGEQLIAVAATLVWSFVVTYILAKVIDATIGLRVKDDQEAEGLDVTQHAEAAYAYGDFGSMGRVGS
jgi:ammonium transporter, Amt family